ncbi:uncharacterized protein LOC113523098 [Galleria mellonella]|uniref:Uncharacterized protein LOC113523098 n=1 Tax=Galleria mellonella TaxID=7137 RepID=A0A6J1X9A4_GALME|nr:uncharacterized protein LOC113523098 [Galleria mellonella]
MEFFGLTLYGPQNYIKDIMREEYQEPNNKDDVNPLMRKIIMYSTMPKQIQRPDVDAISLIDCYLGRVNGFAYGSIQRFITMKRKGVIKPAGPSDMYRFPPTTSMEFGWWQHDPEITLTTWHHTHPRYPQPASPNTLILDKVRKNNKYATLF